MDFSEMTYFFFWLGFIRLDNFQVLAFCTYLFTLTRSIPHLDLSACGYTDLDESSGPSKIFLSIASFWIDIKLDN